MSEENNYYLDKEQFKAKLIKYNRMNYEDDGSWLDRYTMRMDTKKKNKSMSANEYDVKEEFVNNKRKQIQETREHWANLTSLERREYDDEFQKVINSLTTDFMNIIKGRCLSYHLFNRDDISDIRAEALIAMFRYCNRYDEDSNTSAFAYCTQICNNAIMLYLQQDKEQKEKEIAVDSNWYYNLGHNEKEDSGYEE